MKNRILAALVAFGAISSIGLSQAVLFTPGGITGISSSSSNVGVNQSAPGVTFSVNGTCLGPDEIPIQATSFGYSSIYKVLRVGLDQSHRALALNVNPASVTGGNFTGAGQILIGNKGVLAPNASGSNWMAVLRATNGKVYLGGDLSSGEVLGNSLVVSGTSVGIGTNAPQRSLDIVVGDYDFISVGNSTAFMTAGKFAGVSLGFVRSDNAFRKTAIVWESTGDGHARGN